MRTALLITASVLAGWLAWPLTAETEMQTQPGSPVTCQQESADGIGDDNPHVAAICAAVEAAATAARVAPGTDIVLVVEALRADFFRGHLRWQAADSVQTGPSIEFGILDATLGPAQYDALARGLINASDLPLGDSPQD